MPRAPKAGAAAPAPNPEGDPWEGAVPPIDLTPAAAQPEPPAEAESTPPDETRVIAEASAAADREPDPLEQARTMEDPSGGEMEGSVLPDPKPTPAKKAPAKRASRAKPQPVTGVPDPSLPGGSEVKATLEYGTLADEEDFLNGLWYGPEGVGKTTGALRAADFGRVMVVNAEGGLKKRALARMGINVENIVTWPPPGQEDLLTRAGLEGLGYRLRQDLRDDPKSWYAVVWDSGSAIAEKVLRQVVRAEVAKNAALPEHKQKPSRADEFFTDLSDYGTMTAQMVPLIQQYRDLQCHFLVTALERRDVDEDTGQVMYGPVFTPAVSSAIRADMDVVIRVRQAESEDGTEMVVIGATRPNDRYRGKDRFGATPIRMADPSFTRVLSYVEGELDEANDPTQKTLPPVISGRKTNKES